MYQFDHAEVLLKEFKGDAYLHGLGILPKVGKVAAELGQRAVLVADQFPGSDSFIQTIEASLADANVSLIGEIFGAAPNCPREDLYRIMQNLVDLNPDVVISFGGGSTIDAAKAAELLRILGGSIDDYFGTGLVTKAIQATGKSLTPHMPIQTASSSAAHLTKYSNITDIRTGQKKLIVDNAIVPIRPVFDYAVTFNAPNSLTADGALDGMSHSLEVLYSAVNKPEYAQIESVASESIRLVVNFLPQALQNPSDIQSRHALGLATDLGGYAIMLGGTNGAHLTSFSLVDILSHGRACGMLNPYYTVFFAPAIQETIRKIGKIFQDAGYTNVDLEKLTGRDLGIAVAKAMIAFEKFLDFPTTLNEVPGFSKAHIERALAAAKTSQLKMKLENMPVPMTAEMVDEYMAPILRAAATGDLHLIKTVQ